MIGARGRRIATVVASDDEKILWCEGSEDVGDRSIDLFEGSTIPDRITAVTIERIRIDKVDEDDFACRVLWRRVWMNEFLGEACLLGPEGCT